ncbi:MAG: phosphatase PAP2 family protein [Prevotella sp.]|nr:phosphatase PAP2 family protein [Prevotella sp.]
MKINLFKIEKKPCKGLFAYEWVVAAYLLLTFIVIFFCYTKLPNAQAMIWGRLRLIVTTAAMILVYRLIPCRFTRLARAALQLAFLSLWYPDTYEINRIFPNLDHLFAQWEQQIFGCHPALLFSQEMPWSWFSELMDLGYVSYFPMIVTVVIFYFFFRYEEFHRTVFIILGAFFIYYVIFIFLPVTGPQYYYGAIGIDQVAQGVFPNVHDYFNHSMERMTSPGYANGIFYQMVEDAHNAGERPTAAFPSSHVGITTVLMFLAWHSKSKRLFFILLPFFILMFFATVYIQAHYAIDAIAGLITGALLYWGLVQGIKRSKM